MLALLFTLVSSAAAYDHSEWQAVLDKYLSSSATVNYADIQASGALNNYVAGLATATEPSGRAEKMAFWINAYNAITVDMVSRSWPIGSIQELDGGKVWTTRTFAIAGQTLTLDQMEKQKLVPLGDPRIHLALNCASLGCPPLSPRAFTGAKLEDQLNLVTRSWLPGKGVLVQQGAGELMLSPIFDWYAQDFPNDGSGAVPGVEERLRGALQFIARHLPQSEAAWVRAGGYAIRFSTYSWTINSS